MVENYFKVGNPNVMDRSHYWQASNHSGSH